MRRKRVDIGPVGTGLALWALSSVLAVKQVRATALDPHAAAAALLAGTFLVGKLSEVHYLPMLIPGLLFCLARPVSRWPAFGAGVLLAAPWYYVMRQTPGFVQTVGVVVELLAFLAATAAVTASSMEADPA